MRAVKSGAYWSLWAATVPVTAVSFEMPRWTGVRSSTEWPIGVAILLAGAWLLGIRRTEALLSILVGSAGGIGTGLLVSKLWHASELHRPVPLASLVTGLVFPGILAWMLVWTQRVRARSLRSQDETDKRIEEIRALPPDKAVAALKKEIADLRPELERAERQMRLVPWLVGSSGVLGLVMLLLAPRMGPLAVVLDLVIMVLCVVFFAIYRKGTRQAQETGEG
ncbi:MAG: hypothetical protein JSS66_01675 [Armatimonadetes bacterium]|nr:hypothetical protein [Armatimonadota bacterium]